MDQAAYYYGRPSVAVEALQAVPIIDPLQFSPRSTSSPLPFRPANTISPPRSLSSQLSHSERENNRYVPDYGGGALDLPAYIEQSRSALESQRLSFDRERIAFAEERKLWERERAIMKKRITELEQRVSHAVGDHGSSPGSGGSPIWDPSRSVPTRPTRVFSSDREINRFGRVNAAGRFGGSHAAPSLDDALSPRTQAADRSAHFSIPIELVDSTLDGITLKSTGLPREVMDRVSTPPHSAQISPPYHFPPHRSSGASDSARTAEQRHASHSSTTPPPENNASAERTPKPVMIPEASSDEQTPDDIDAADSGFFPLVPQQTREVGHDAALPDTIFPPPEDDPALTGQLSLQNNETLDLDFLKALDEKLAEEARRPRADSTTTASTSDDHDQVENDSEAEIKPELRFRNATNFGTAFGTLRFAPPRPPQ